MGTYRRSAARNYAGHGPRPDRSRLDRLLQIKPGRPSRATRENDGNADHVRGRQQLYGAWFLFGKISAASRQEEIYRPWKRPAMLSITPPPGTTIVVPSGQLSGFKGWFVRSRAILRARLEYARRGWFTFPAPFNGDKKSLKKKTKKNPINWGATNDPQVIRREFLDPYLREQNIGLM